MRTCRDCEWSNWPPHGIMGHDGHCQPVPDEPVILLSEVDTSEDHKCIFSKDGSLIDAEFKKED